LIRQNNQGAPIARNNGYKLSRGEYVIFWDADVIANQDMLKKMYQVLEDNPDISYAYSNFYFGKKKMPAQRFDADRLEKRNYIMTSSLIRRKDFPGFDESLKKFQDWDLWLTMLKKNRTGIWINEYLMRIIVNKNGMSAWLPRMAYYPPFRWLPGISDKVLRYEQAKTILFKKHKLI